MTKLHTFGCSITQGHALPDLVKPITDEHGRALSIDELRARKEPLHWEDIHVYAASKYAWPQVLADRLGLAVENHARRGACTNQIARQCVAARDSIQPGDIVIVMWTYLSRISLQWPARTAVPLCHVVDSHSKGWLTRILPGFNKLYGLSRTDNSDHDRDQKIQKYIAYSTRYTYLDPLGLYDRYYNSLVTQSISDGFLRNFGARVIHLSVEPQSYLDQLELIRSELDPSLIPYSRIPDPQTWYSISVDHDISKIIHDPSIPPAENDMHPSVTHHENFALAVYERYFI